MIRSGPRLAAILIGSVLVSFGATKLLSQGFIFGWERNAAGQPDIAARGIWILALLLPVFGGIGIASGIAATATLKRDAGGRWVQHIGVSVIGGVLGAVLLITGLDPTVSLLQMVDVGGSAWMVLASIGIAIGIIAAGGLVLLRSGAPASQTDPPNVG